MINVTWIYSQEAWIRGPKILQLFSVCSVQLQFSKDLWDVLSRLTFCLCLFGQVNVRWEGSQNISNIQNWVLNVSSKVRVMRLLFISVFKTEAQIFLLHWCQDFFLFGFDLRVLDIQHFQHTKVHRHLWNYERDTLGHDISITMLLCLILLVLILSFTQKQKYVMKVGGVALGEQFSLKGFRD